MTEADGSTTSYGYDADGQLLSEMRTGTGAYSISYSYDEVGNRLTKSENGALTSYAYDIANQVLSEQAPQGSTSYTYDLNRGRRLP